MFLEYSFLNGNNQKINHLNTKIFIDVFNTSELIQTITDNQIVKEEEKIKISFKVLNSEKVELVDNKLYLKFYINYNETLIKMDDIITLRS